MTPKKKPHLLIQTIGSVETRAALAFAYKRDWGILRASLNDIGRHDETLEQLGRRAALPVGSVQFVEQVMRHYGVRPPATLTYPRALEKFYLRPIEAKLLYDVDLNGSAPLFIKPASAVKLFDGFVITPSDDAAIDAHRLDQLAKIRALPCTTPLFVSPAVVFVSEWRVYVHRHTVVGVARYDSNETERDEPDAQWLKRLIHHYRASGDAPIAYGLDVGQMEDGRWAVVEVNDAWALGLYAQMSDHDRYMQMLYDRWLQIRRPETDRWDPLWKMQNKNQTTKGEQ